MPVDNQSSHFLPNFNKRINQVSGLKFSLQKYPFVRITLAFATGIFVAWKTGADHSTVFVVLTHISLIAAFLLHILVKSYTLRWMAGLMLHIVFLSAGYWAASVGMPDSIPGHFSQHNPSKAYLVRLTEPLSERRSSFRAIAEVKALADSGNLIPVRGRIMVYFRKPSAHALPDYGDYIIINKSPVRIPPPLNPGQFDFAKHLERKGVLHQVFLNDDQWQSTGISRPNPLFGLAYQTRDHLVKVMKDNGMDGDEFAVASAILLGYDEMLSHELRKGYTAAGAMHVLCVSGLHVGIIFLIFGLMLQFFERLRYGVLLRGMLLLFIIWFYAFITGLSPSVMRSALMISFLVVGQMLKRRGQALNSLAAAALFILIIDPASLFSIGFQLSFTAVAGILLFQRELAQLVVFRNRIAGYFWEATTVALAAQISTTPFVLYYFNQFPLYFWLSNLFLTPLSFLIISLGMLMLLSSPLPWLPYGFGLITSALIFAMNALILWVESLPMAVIKSLYINWFELIILITLAVFAAIWVQRQSNKLIIPVLFMIFLAVGSMTIRHIRSLKQEGFLVYSLAGRAALSFIHGQQHVMVADSIVLSDQGLIEFNMTRYWNARSLNDPVKIGLSETFQNVFMVKEGNYVVFSGKLLCLYDLAKPQTGPDADVYLIRGSKVSKKVRPVLPNNKGLFLLDTSLNPRLSEQYLLSVLGSDAEIVDLRTRGAYIGLSK